MVTELIKPPKVTPVLKNMTDEQFMTFQASRPEEERWQLVDGVPFMMTAARSRHQRLCLNLANLLQAGLEKTRKNLVALTERGLMVPGVHDFRPTADVAIHKDDDGGSYHDVFYLAAEILSESKTLEHIETKRQRYMQHPDNLHVLIVSQFERKVEHWARSRKWKLIDLTKTRDVVELPEFGCRFTLARLYRGTPLE